MISRTLLFCSFLPLLATAAVAQQPNGSIDLDVAAGELKIVVAGLSFLQSDVSCAEDKRGGVLRIHNGTLFLISYSLPTDTPPFLGWSRRAPVDDETDPTWIGTQSCRLDMTIRQQVRRDASWVSLLVPRESRPSTPSEERQELHRQLLENLHKPRELSPAEKDGVDRFQAAFDAQRAMGGLGVESGTTVFPIVFDDRPQTCFEAWGDYRIVPNGILFSFMPGLAGELNRFLMERTDLDSTHSRLTFTRGDCRFELTISQSVRLNGEWIAVPLAPNAQQKQ
jgi:hypothetical protein